MLPFQDGKDTILPELRDSLLKVSKVATPPTDLFDILFIFILHWLELLLAEESLKRSRAW